MNKQRLNGKTILNIRPLERSLPLAHAIENEGGRCIVLPSIEIVPVISSIEQINQAFQSDYWIFVSQYAVKLWREHVYGKSVVPKTIAIGKATAEALQEAKMPVDLVPEEPSSESVLQLPAFQSLQGKTVTIFRGKSGRTLIDDTLRERSAAVNEVILYERILPTWTEKEHSLLNTKIDLALGLSVDSLTYFFAQLNFLEKQRLYNVPWLVMSHRVAEEAKKLSINKIFKVSHSDIFESLIRCCSPDIIGVDYKMGH